jgi:hypothetical protein
MLVSDINQTDFLFTQVKEKIAMGMTAINLKKMVFNSLTAARVKAGAYNFVYVVCPPSKVFKKGFGSLCKPNILLHDALLRAWKSFSTIGCSETYSSTSTFKIAWSCWLLTKPI